MAFKIRQNPFSAPDPAGGAHNAPPDALVGWRADTPPHAPPHSARTHLRCHASPQKSSQIYAYAVTYLTNNISNGLHVPSVVISEHLSYWGCCGAGQRSSTEWRWPTVARHEGPVPRMKGRNWTASGRRFRTSLPSVRPLTLAAMGPQAQRLHDIDLTWLLAYIDSDICCPS